MSVHLDDLLYVLAITVFYAHLPSMLFGFVSFLSNTRPESDSSLPASCFSCTPASVVHSVTCYCAYGGSILHNVLLYLLILVLRFLVSSNEGLSFEDLYQQALKC